jgi:3-methylfumaryl-CoA hydratase
MAYDEYIGKTETRTDTVSALSIRALAASLDVEEAEVAPDGLLPPLWHWMLFQEWAPASGLGPDGHPRRGGFLPPVHDLPRRMWAGGEVEFVGRLRAGDPVTRKSTITQIEEKTGGSGRLVFVTVRHELAAMAGPAMIEVQNIVYRGVEGAAVRSADVASPQPAGAFRRTVVPDPVLLFRYSALTGNGHRIHYDLDYVTRVEGYPRLVVHGPLQATLLADLVRRMRQGVRIARMAYRGRRPAFHQNPLLLIGQEKGGRISLESRDHENAVCMTADVTLA